MGKLRRAPFRCRSCHNRFYVYIPREDEEMEEVDETEEVEEQETAETGEPGPEDDRERNSDVARRAEP